MDKTCASCEEPILPAEPSFQVGDLFIHSDTLRCDALALAKGSMFFPADDSGAQGWDDYTCTQKNVLVNYIRELLIKGKIRRNV